MMSYRISEVAALLGVSDDTVRRWLEDGRIEAVEGSSPRKVTGVSLANYLSQEHKLSGSHDVSTRNMLKGLIIEVKSDTVMSQVIMQCGPFRVVSLISTEAVKDLGLEPGVIANAQIKATNVSIVK
ncbi:TOBE domain-containing protein [Propionimicrobium lymphophilum]|uniref:TOBE domain-containing protein n=1 Tax=Propionimicrobium lymphophilum TaxID=33012 RepID=UPI0023F26754|nr:TOBE domain-containing protein [Propionimicrobium lymphophilum]